MKLSHMWWLLRNKYALAIYMTWGFLPVTNQLHLQTSDALCGVYHHCGFQHTDHKSLGAHQTGVSQWYVQTEACQMLLKSRSPRGCSFYVLLENKCSFMKTKKQKTSMSYISRLQLDLKRKKKYKKTSFQDGAGPRLSKRASMQAWRVNRATWMKDENKHWHMMEWCKLYYSLYPHLSASQSNPPFNCSRSGVWPCLHVRMESQSESVCKDWL